MKSLLFLSLSGPICSEDIQDYSRAERLVERGLSYDSPTHRPALLMWYGEVAIGVGDFEIAITRFHNALTEVRDNSRLQAQTLNSLGRALAGMSKYSDAHTYVVQALEIAQEVGDHRQRARCLLALASISKFVADFEACQDYAEQALLLFRDLDDRLGISWALNNLGIVAEKTGDYTKSEMLHLESMDIAVKMGHRVSVAITLINLGISAEFRDAYEEACIYYDQAIAIFRDLGERVGIANCLLNKGNALFSLNQFDNARELAEEAMCLVQEIGTKYGIAFCSGLMGDIAEEQGDYLGAKAHYESAQSILAEIGSMQECIEYQSDLVIVLLRLGDRKAACALLTEAIQGVFETNAAPTLMRVLRAVIHLAYLDGRFEESAAWLGLFMDEENRGAKANLSRKEMSVKLQTTLGIEKYSMHIEQGKLLDLKTILQTAVAELLV